MWRAHKRTSSKLLVPRRPRQPAEGAPVPHLRAAHRIASADCPSAMLRRLAALCLAATAAAVLPTISASSSSRPAERSSRWAFSGDHQAIALIERVNKSYRNVRTVRIRATFSGVSIDFTLHLRTGIVWGEQAVIRTASGTTTLSGTTRRGTYVRDAGRRCWRFVPRGDHQALADLGKPVLTGPGQLKPPVPSHWGRVLIDVVRSGHTVERIVVNHHTHRVVIISTAQPHAIFWFATPHRAPALPSPNPRC
jgi:hypothetical protein